MWFKIIVGSYHVAKINKLSNQIRTSWVDELKNKFQDGQPLSLKCPRFIHILRLTCRNFEGCKSIHWYHCWSEDSHNLLARDGQSQALRFHVNVQGPALMTMQHIAPFKPGSLLGSMTPRPKKLCKLQFTIVWRCLTCVPNILKLIRFRKVALDNQPNTYLDGGQSTNTTQPPTEYSFPKISLNTIRPSPKQITAGSALGGWDYVCAADTCRREPLVARSFSCDR